MITTRTSLVNKKTLTQNIKHPYRNLNALDLATNILLLVFALTPLPLLIIDFSTNNLADATSLLLLLMIPLGLYQLISALVGALRGNQIKGFYLLGILVYFYSLQYMPEPTSLGISERLAATFYLLLPSLLGAFLYTFLCYRAYVLSR